VNSRRKGHDEERRVAGRYREIGFVHAKTSRSVSGGMQKGHDVEGLPWPIEVKHTAPAHPDVNMTAISRWLNDHHGVYHARITRRGAYVVVKEETWCRVLQALLQQSLEPLNEELRSVRLAEKRSAGAPEAMAG